MKTNDIFLILKENGDYLTSSLIKEYKIDQEYLSWLVEKQRIKKIKRGMYISSIAKRDKYYEIYLDNSALVFSLFSSLEILGFGKYAKGIYVTVDSKYHNYKLEKLNVSYVPRNYLYLGVKKTKTKLGHLVLTYDLERTICDIIRLSTKLELDVVHKILKKYMKYPKKDLDKIWHYAKVMNITKKVSSFLALS